MTKFSRFYACLLGMLLGSCEGNSGDDCGLGELDCACNNGQCLAGLSCEANVCVQQIGDENTSSSGEVTSEDSTSDATVDDTSDGMSSSDESETGPMCDPPQMMCGDDCVDVMTDNANCGDCGNDCTVVFGEGECVDGECSPTWSSCVEANPLTPCTMVCQEQGFQGCALCGNLAVTWFPVPSLCEDGTSSDEEVGMCETEPDAALSNFYRCCCAQQ